MQRPMMDPMLLLEDEPARRPNGKGQLRKVVSRIVQAARAVAKILFSQPFQIRRREPEDSLPRLTRWARGIGYRLLFVPIFIALTGAALVFRATHPVRAASNKLPEVPTPFYETMEFNGSDGHPLMAWFVPVVDAKRVIELKNKVFKGKQPAVLLVHDYNAAPSQMVPMITPLHDQGYVVMAVGLRGAGRGRMAAQTFGLNEASDIRAALTQLRQRPTVDADQIAIVGIGTGATAAVIAASQEPGVKALALIDQRNSTEQIFADLIGPDRYGARWMQQVSKWVFEVAYHVDAEDLNLARFRETIERRQVVSLHHGGGKFEQDLVDAVGAFCREKLPPNDSTDVASVVP